VVAKSPTGRILGGETCDADGCAKADILAFNDSRKSWPKIHSTDEIDKQFFCELGDFAEIASGPLFCSAMPRPFFRPGRRSVSRRAQGLSRLAASAAATGLALIAPSTVAG
jgi:hypothetical protein